MADINEEFIAEYARVVGNAFTAIDSGIGDENTPGSAIFTLNQLSFLADRKLPAFGIVQNINSTGFTVTVDENDPTFIKISSGQIAYKNNNINVPSQRVSIVRTVVGTYNNTDVYGMKIGFPYSEAVKTSGQIYSSVLTQTTSMTSNVVYVENPQRIIDLGFPITAYIGSNTYVVFNGTNADSTGFTIDPAINGGFLPTVFDEGTNVNFIYEPKIKAIYGLPVPVASNDPSTFKYYPNLPSDWLPIADILVENPNDPGVAIFGSNNAILRTATDYPPANSTTPIFSDTDAQIIASSIKVAKSQLVSNKDRASVSEAIRALENYTSALQTNAGLGFRQFWGARPLKQTTYYNKGVSFEGLERFEFSDNFSQAYYELSGRDTQKTLGFFRGDLYGSPSVIAGNAPSSITTGTKDTFIGTTSSLTRGTYTYGVSAVTSAGETPATYKSVITSSIGATNLNTIQWSSVSGALFYHVYRRSNTSGEQVEYRLTTPGEISGTGTFVNSPVTPNDTYSLTTSGVAFKIIPSGSTQFGGILFQMKATDYSLTNIDDYVSVKIYSNNVSTSKPNAEVLDLGTVPFGSIIRNSNGDLTTDFQKIICQADYKLTTGNIYWVVLALSNAASTGNIQIHISNATATGQLATYSSPNWTLVNNKTAYYEILGYIDNGRTGSNAISRGVYLTGKTTLEPRRLRIYLPEIENFPTRVNALYGEGATTTETATTKNEMLVTVVAQLGSDTPVTLPTITIPQGTSSGASFLLGSTSQVFDKIVDLRVVPGANVVRKAQNAIYWSKYDTFVVENIP